jgi:hypothetical protein
MEFVCLFLSSTHTESGGTTQHSWPHLRRSSGQLSNLAASLDSDTLLSIHLIRTGFAVDRLCGLVVRVLGYRSGGPVSIHGTTKKKKK